MIHWWSALWLCVLTANITAGAMSDKLTEKEMRGFVIANAFSVAMAALGEAFRR